MSGFTGFIGETSNASVVLESMMDNIIHRGPDSSVMFSENEAALGLRRLSNMGVGDDSQPYYTEDESFVLTFTGEIYNAHELKEKLISAGYVFNKHTVGEVLIRGYEEYGESLPEKLRGKFAFVIWDRKNKKLFGARDMFGIQPFYYAHMNGTLFFGSEIKSFLPHIHFNKELNEKALKPYLTFQFSVLNETFFKGVFKLSAAHYMTYVDGQINTQRYWSPEFNPIDQSFEEIVEEIDQTVRESIHAHQTSEVKVGSFLSSGVDSSYVVSVLNPEKTFTVGFDHQNFSEIDNARKLSNELGIENSNAILDPDLIFEKLEDIQYMMDEPHSDPSIVPLYFLAELASRDAKVVFSGEGADELFGGYAEYDSTVLMKKYKKLLLSVRKPLGLLSKHLPEVRGKNFLIKGGLSPEEWFIGQAKIFEEKAVSKILTSPYTNTPTVKEIVKPFYDQVKGEDDVTKMQYLDLNLWLADDILLKADKMCMAHSIDVRMPFLDREVMKIASKVPTKYRVHDIETKYAFRIAAKRTLPEECSNRKKIGFPVPIRHWIREEKYYLKIKAYFESVEAAEFFNQQAILDLLNDHYKGKVNNGRKVWTIFTFLVWHKKYFN
ncbi:asparagine synthase (glutamine-hydrolyzing) [Sporosarcina sp. NPDC096371]|uniref:asparagine synthase (glutamine-hydrolyzing) n=1 Tax=Sporosarcina sp. NPDC096371 TaxID=3364530 RepID=UPI003810F7E0